MLLMEAKIIIHSFLHISKIQFYTGAAIPTTTASTAQTSSSVTSSSTSFWSWFLLSIVLPVGLAVLSAAAVSFFTTRCTYKHEKRIEAKYGHHKQLNQALSELNARFKTCNCTPDCNPFCMKYKDTVLISNGLLQIPLGNQDKCRNAFLPLANRINKLISEKDVNINPTSISMEEWTAAQQTLREFTQLIIEGWGVETVDSNTGIHQINWESLKRAIQTIVDSTDYTKQG